MPISILKHISNSLFRNAFFEKIHPKIKFLRITLGKRLDYILMAKTIRAITITFQYRIYVKKHETV